MFSEPTKPRRQTMLDPRHLPIAPGHGTTAYSRRLPEIVSYARPTPAVCNLRITLCVAGPATRTRLLRLTDLVER